MMRRLPLALLLVLVALFTATPAVEAQLVYNPTTVEFDVLLSEHNDGTVSRYEIRFFVDGQTNPVATADLGKPAPVSGTLVRVVNPALFSPLLPLVQYTAKVVAIGPTALEGMSGPSNPFRRVGTPTAPSDPVLK